MALICVEGLTKQYGGDKGLYSLSFQVEEGEAFALLGPNGAGKTTLIRHLLGFIRPESGRALIHGWECWREAVKVKRIVGYLPGEIHFLEGMKGLDFLQLVCGLHGDKAIFSRRRTRLAKRLDIDLNQDLRQMSKGMKQKVGLIAALMLDAPVLILDEPTSGFDPLMKRVFVDLIREEKERGKTLLLASHNFDEVERTCERVGILRTGQLAAIGRIEALRQAHAAQGASLEEVFIKLYE